MTAEETFEPLRGTLIGFCYRMLGSVSDAEDIVHDAYLRWEQAGRPSLDAPRSWFLKVCARLCLDQWKSARAQRESYYGEWLPEPFLPDSFDQVELDETVSIALMLTMERLKPAERAAFLLHDVFGYEFTEVAEMLGLEAAHCRQLAVRARAHLRGDKTRAAIDRDAVQRVSDAFFSAVKQGDLAALQQVLAEDVVLRSDGGGKVPAALVPIVGADRVIRFVTGVFRKAGQQQAVELRPVWFNGAPGMAVFVGSELASAYQLELAGAQIRSIYIHRNPDKLRAIAVGATTAEA